MLQQTSQRYTVRNLLAWPAPLKVLQLDQTLDIPAVARRQKLRLVHAEAAVIPSAHVLDDYNTDCRSCICVNFSNASGPCFLKNSASSHWV